MFDSDTAAGAPASHERLALQMIGRRQIRRQFFDDQFFGELGWELLLLLFAHRSKEVCVASAANLLRSSPSLIAVMARLLASHGLVSQGDSASDWGGIPLQISEEGDAKVREYLDHLQKDRLFA